MRQGVHVMPLGWDDLVPRIVSEAGLRRERAVLGRILVGSAVTGMAAEGTRLLVLGAERL